ncbi:adenylate and Guanylate cyclase catalytic domain protein [Methyloversatilis sp. RAC08]|uniref:CHASE2 domain-containing protein n=1 Tax=Methyloversatilis sp. RAC08 TaxID=1842540 RepID=UPI00083E2981|nr:adenylate/guanylate cyclase domain-containing protein [Methyloversatilis sp. RAC08]AOF82139.1 adenylate and Guanylate cyclase catalytic domain protein [Methyloversatilis sp. RAC08]
MNSRKRRAQKGLAIGLLTALVGITVSVIDSGGSFERSAGLSWLFRLRGPVTPPQEVVVVAIDGRTGEHLGLPSQPRDWPRTVHAGLVDELTRRGASAIVFDMQFDKSRVSADDVAFAAAVDRSDRVVLIELVTGKRQPVTDAEGRPSGSIWVEQLVQPLPSLVDAAKGLATFPLPKIDAAVYEFWVFKESVGDAPTLPAAALQVHALKLYPIWMGMLRELGVAGLDDLPADLAGLGKAASLRTIMGRFRERFENDPTAGERLLALIEARSDLPTDQRDLLRALCALYSGDPHRLLNFYGPPGTVPTVFYQDLVDAQGSGTGRSTFDFRGRTVFVGFADLYDPGHPDRFYTVFTNDDGVDLSGVEIAATAFGNLMTDRSIRMLDSAQTAGVLFAFGLFAGALAYLLPALAGVPLVIALAGLYALAAQLSFNATDLWMPLATPLLVQLPLALFLGLSAQYLLERGRGRRMSKALGYYVPENVARDLTDRQVDPHAFNRVVYGTCLATDMSGFSTISEQLPPDQLAVFLNDYFDTLAGALKRQKVDVTEFRADAIMCAWTADKPDAAVRRQAVLAALGASDAITGFKQRHPMLKASLRVGLEAGNFYVGHAGGGGHFVFSIVGDTANTASRIEGLNKHIGTQILATQAVVDGLDGFLLRPLGDFQFVGKSGAIPIFEVMGTETTVSDMQRALSRQFEGALAIFHSARWDAATAAFEALLQAFPDDGPSLFYRTRCGMYSAGTPAPEDARVIRMDAK